MNRPELRNKLINYSVLSASFLLVQQNVNAQAVYYKDYAPDVLVNSDNPAMYDEFSIDVNQDGVDDFRIFAREDSNAWSTWGTLQIAITPFGDNSVADVYSFQSCTTSASSISTRYRQVAQAMSVGQVVSSGLDWVNGTRDLHYRTWCSCYYHCSFGLGQFTGVSHIPIRFDNDGDSHYGWIRVERVLSSRVTIFEHALNAIPGAPLTIAAGAYTNCDAPTSLSVVFSGPSVATLSWSAVPTADKYLLTGKKVGSPASYSKTLTTNSKSVAGFTTGSTYEWQVRTQCTDGAISPSSALNTFTVPAPLAVENSSLRVLGSSHSTATLELILQEAGEGKIKLINLSGVVLKEQNFTFEAGINTLQVDHDLSPGFYLLTVDQIGIRETVGLTVAR